MGHMADALHHLPEDSSKLTVLLSIHTSLQHHMNISSKDQEPSNSALQLRLSNDLKAKIENLKSEAVFLRREGKVRDALQTMRAMKRAEHTLAIRPWQRSMPHQRPIAPTNALGSIPSEIQDTGNLTLDTRRPSMLGKIHQHILGLSVLREPEV